MNRQTIPMGRLMVAGTMTAMSLACWLVAEAADPPARATRGRTATSAAEPRESLSEAATAPARGARSGRRSATPWDTTTFHLERIVASTVAERLGTLEDNWAREVRVVAVDDPATLVVAGPPEAMQFVGALVRQLEAAAAVVTRGPPASTVPKVHGEPVETPLAPAATPAPVFFYLKQVSVRSVFPVIEDLMDTTAPGFTVATEPRLNALVASGPPEMIEIVRQLVEVLDVPSERFLQKTTKIFRVEHANAQTAAETVSRVIDSSEARIAVDTATNALVVSSTPETMEQIGQVLSDLDAAAAQTAEPRDGLATYRVRIIWLVSGAGLEGAYNPPAEDLEKVVAELAKIGVLGVLQVGQVIVNSAPAGTFQTVCSPLWDGAPAELKVSGQLRDTQGVPSLQISIDAKQTTSVDTPGGRVNQTASLATLRTDIAAPPGHQVVLGVTPMGSDTSVFVVEITPN